MLLMENRNHRHTGGGGGEGVAMLLMENRNHLHTGGGGGGRHCYVADGKQKSSPHRVGGGGVEQRKALLCMLLMENRNHRHTGGGEGGLRRGRHCYVADGK